MNNPFGTGAVKSPKDPRTVKVSVMAAEPLIKGGVEYRPQDIEHQHKVGICTAISMVQLRQRKTGKKYSPEFQYLMQKREYDGNWDEGSSIFHALKVAKNIGFLEKGHWTFTNENDRLLPYSQYIAKLKAIPQEGIYRLAGKKIKDKDGKDVWVGGLTVDHIPGYGQLDESDSQSIAKGIDESDAGILCMYGCSDAWWLPSWFPKDINPLRRKSFTSYHAIVMSMFDYSKKVMQKVSNTWGVEWCMNGNADIEHTKYAPIEAWAVLKEEPVIPPFKFNRNMWFGQKNTDIMILQQRLGIVPNTGFFGAITFAGVVKYQLRNGILATGFVGPITRSSLNQNNG